VLGVIHLFLVDPVMLSRLPALNLLGGEPQSNLLLGTFNAIRAVADIATDINGIVTADGTRGGCERVGGAEDGYQSISDVLTSKVMTGTYHDRSWWHRGLPRPWQRLDRSACLKGPVSSNSNMEGCFPYR
jgi:hypothetical protein